MSDALQKAILAVELAENAEQTSCLRPPNGAFVHAAMWKDKSNAAGHSAPSTFTPSIQYNIDGQLHWNRPMNIDYVANAKNLTEADLRQYYHLPIAKAARCLGICPTLLKKICRKNNIFRWPFRQLRSLDCSIQAKRKTKDSAPIDSAQNVKVVEQLEIMNRKREKIITDPNLASISLGQNRKKRRKKLAPSGQPPAPKSDTLNGTTWPYGPLATQNSNSKFLPGIRSLLFQTNQNQFCPPLQDTEAFVTPEVLDLPDFLQIATDERTGFSVPEQPQTHTSKEEDAAAIIGLSMLRNKPNFSPSKLPVRGNDPGSRYEDSVPTREDDALKSCATKVRSRIKPVLMSISTITT